MPGSWIEYRGQSFSIGGDFKAVTLPNFFQHYHPCRNNILGPSKGERYISYCPGSWCPPADFLYRRETDGLNAAISGAEVDIIDRQTDYLIQAIRELEEDPEWGDNVKRDWKFITVFMGMNDICDGPCTSVFAPNGQVGSASLYEVQIRKTLESLREALPRTVIHLVQLFDISDLEAWASTFDECCNASWMHNLLCPCTKTELGRHCLSARLKAYNKILENIADDYATFVTVKETADSSTFKIRKRPIYKDFAVILSRTLADLNIMEDVPIDFVSKFDCFHPSTLGHQTVAVALWNDLFKPSDEKSRAFRYPLNIYCPSKNDTIRVD